MGLAQTCLSLVWSTGLSLGSGPTHPSVAPGFVQGAEVSSWAHEAGGVHDPAVHHLLKAPLRERIQHGGSPQGMEVAIGIEAQFGWPVVSACQALAGVT